MHHNDMCMLYLRCSSAAIHLDDFEGALKYLEIALNHFIEFNQVMKMPQMPQFTAPLVSKAKAGNCISEIFALDRKLVEDHMQDLPADCADAIRNNPRYATIFAE
ncbi:MAG: hypothetical protein K2J60_00495 [Acetatifactor sp.]|nr:hypothetical protein [Acetatifactor sp.]